MIWFNIKKLEEKIINNDFSNDEAFKYFLGFSILGTIATYLISSSENIINYIELLIELGITIWGSYAIYKANSSGDGQDFFKRYFALSWVIGFRLFIYTFIVALPLSIMYYTLIEDNSATIEFSAYVLSEEFITMIITSLFVILYYFLLVKSFKRVAVKKN